MTIHFLSAAILAAAVALPAHAASKHDYIYTPSAGVHEKKFFHGCYDNTDAEKRPRISVVMRGLRSTDVKAETRVREAGKPSTEMITFRLKQLDASLTVQFRSSDGPHCQQGVQEIVFTDTVLRGAQELP
jgi:hypothetical protein